MIRFCLFIFLLFNAIPILAQIPEICTNGLDDDGDGDIDCEDDECLLPVFENAYFDSANSVNVSLGDLDGDGLSDAVVVNDYPDQCKVYINDGSGLMLEHWAFPQGQNVDLADFDSDGDLDIVIARCNGGGDSSVLLNNGDATFSTSLEISGCATDVAVGDFNADNYQDIIFMRSDLPALLILNDGTGAMLGSGQPILTTEQYGSLYVCDMNADSHLDLWFCDSSPVNDAVFFNDGFGSFVNSNQMVGAGSTTGVTFGDVDSDGDVDVLTTYRDTHTEKWLNDGFGVFQPGGIINTGEPAYGSFLGDLDGDAVPDLVVVTAGNSLNQGVNELWINDGLGNFALGSSPLGYGRGASLDVAGSDLDNDGDVDLYIANNEDGGGPNYILKNDGDGQFVDRFQTLGSDESNHVSMSDLNGDGFVDVLISHSTGARAWLNNGLGRLSPGQNLSSFNVVDAALGDFDLDGDPDVWLMRGGDYHIIYLNDGNAEFVSSDVFGAGSCNGVGMGDLDGDGDLDAWGVYGGSSYNRVWFNDGQGTFVDGGQELGANNSTDVALGDVDDDGDLDAWVTNRSNQPNRLYLNDGAGFFTDSGQEFGIIINTESVAVSLGDIDLDGDLDAFVVAFANNSNQIYLNDGLGVFTFNDQFVGNGCHVSLGDLDGDGDLDFFESSCNSVDYSNKVYVNDGFGNYAQSDQFFGDSLSRASGLADLDGNDSLDVVVANADSGPNTFGIPDRVYLNIGVCDPDLDNDGILNACDPDHSLGEDCNSNGILDSCDISGGAEDNNSNGIPDECEETQFIRGDVNGDSGIDISDAITVLGYLFTGGSIDCEKAADSNDDGAVNVADGIQILGYLFSGTGDPPAPFPDCGGDPTPDSLGCESFVNCP